MGEDDIKKHLCATSKERLFENLYALKAELKKIESELRGIDRLADNALSWEPLITDVDENRRN